MNLESVNLIGWGVGSFTLTLFLCILLGKFAQPLGLVDHPNSTTKKHVKPTPIIGGIALWSSSSIIFFVTGSGPFLSFWVPVTLMTLVGLLDDWWELSPLWKLILQLNAALSFILLNEMSFSVGLATALAILLIVNSLNYMDNNHGVCGGTSGIILLGMLALGASPLSSQMLIVLIGSIIGFLFLNFPRGKIFLGDTGTHFFGAIISYSLINWTYQNPSHRWSSLILISVPVIDAVQVTLSRLLRGKPIWKSDSYHLAPLLISKGLTLPRAVTIIWMATFLTILIAYYTSTFESNF